jgi:hypothetical protein
MPRLVTLAQINEALGITLSASFLTDVLNVAQCDESGRWSADSGTWDANDYDAIVHRLGNQIWYRSKPLALEEEFEWGDNDFFRE